MVVALGAEIEVEILTADIGFQIQGFCCEFEALGNFSDRIILYCCLRHGMLSLNLHIVISDNMMKMWCFSVKIVVYA